MSTLDSVVWFVEYIEHFAIHKYFSNCSVIMEENLCVVIRVLWRRMLDVYWLSNKRKTKMSAVVLLDCQYARFPNALPR